MPIGRMKDLATEMVRALFLAQLERESNPDCKRLQSSIVTNFTSSAYIVQWTPGGRYRPSPGLRPKSETVRDCPGQSRTASSGRTRQFHAKPSEFYVYYTPLLRASGPFYVKTRLKRVMKLFWFLFWTLSYRSLFRGPQGSTASLRRSVISLSYFFEVILVSEYESTLR